MMRMKQLAPFVIAAAATISASQAHTICTAVADGATGKILLQQGDCATRVTPASTFKVAISLMGYDTGFLKDEHAPLLPFREGYPDWIASWRAPTDPASWIRNSVVWYSQQITQSLGEDRFQKYVSAFQYGNEDVSGDAGKNNGLTRAWLSSSLKISPLEQLAFLGRLVNHKLPVTANAFDMTCRITRLSDLVDGWEVHGKTGTGSPVLGDGTHDEDHDYGWFVGWTSKGGRTIVFARLIQEEARAPQGAGPDARAAFLSELPAILTSLPPEN
jgi:beta-lactamase class D